MLKCSLKIKIFENFFKKAKIFETYTSKLAEKPRN